MMIAGGFECIRLLRILTEAIFTHGTVPKDWEKVTSSIYIRGKGEALNRGNYRGLKLTDQVIKVLRYAGSKDPRNGFYW